MLRPEQGGMIRPSIKELTRDTTALLGEDPAQFAYEVGTFFHENPAAGVIAGQLQRLSRHLLPKSDDPNDLRQAAFKDGTGIGLYVASSLYRGHEDALGDELSKLRMELGKRPSQAEQEQLLITTSEHGLASFPDIQDEVDHMTAILQAGEDPKFTLRVGCGVALGLAEQAYIAGEKEAMQDVLDAWQVGAYDFDAEVRDFFTDPNS